MQQGRPETASKLGCQQRPAMNTNVPEDSSAVPSSPRHSSTSQHLHCKHLGRKKWLKPPGLATTSTATQQCRTRCYKHVNISCSVPSNYCWCLPSTLKKNQPQTTSRLINYKHKVHQRLQKPTERYLESRQACYGFLVTTLISKLDLGLS